MLVLLVIACGQTPEATQQEAAQRALMTTSTYLAEDNWDERTYVSDALRFCIISEPAPWPDTWYELREAFVEAGYVAPGGDYDNISALISPVVLDDQLRQAATLWLAEHCPEHGRAG